jgi:hypothetical protein
MEVVYLFIYLFPLFLYSILPLILQISVSKLGLMPIWTLVYFYFYYFYVWMHKQINLSMMHKLFTCHLFIIHF